MEGEAPTPERPRPDEPGRGPRSLDPQPETPGHGHPAPVADPLGSGLVALPMLTLDGEPVADAPASGFGRIPHPMGRPVFVELPTDPAAFSPEALDALARIAHEFLAAPAPPSCAEGQKKAGHDGPAKSNREVKKMSTKHHRLREPK